MSNALTIEAPEGLPFIDSTREFDAPVSAVFRAHADPDLVRRWMGPRGYTMDVGAWDFRSGGSCGSRTRLRIHAVYPSLQARDGMVASGMEGGMREGYEQLEELVRDRADG